MKWKSQINECKTSNSITRSRLFDRLYDAENFKFVMKSEIASQKNEYLIRILTACGENLINRRVEK